MAKPRTPRLPKGPPPEKAKQMLRDNSANGQALSKKQKGLFGAIVGGNSKRKGA